MRQSFLRRFASPRLVLTAGALAVSAFLAAVPARAELAVGEEAPDVTATDYLNTEPISVAQLKGRVILLELFSTT